MLKSSAPAAAAAVLGVCLGVTLADGRMAAAQDTSEFLANLKQNFGSEPVAPTNGVSEEDAIKIALNRGAALRAAREAGIFLTYEQVSMIGTEPLDLASWTPVEPVEVAAPVEAPAVVTDVTPEPEIPIAPEITAPVEEVAEALPDEPEGLQRSLRPRARPVTLASVVASAGDAAIDATTSISTSGDLLFWRVVGERVNLRSGPGTEHDIVTQVGGNERFLPISDTAAEWIEIQLPGDGSTAWIFAEFLAPETN